MESIISKAFDEATCIPPELPIREEIGKSNLEPPCDMPSPAPSSQPLLDALRSVPDNERIGLMWPRGIANEHDAAPLLHSYSIHGCPVDCGRNWSKDEVLAAIQRGAHKTARIPEAREYLLEQTKKKVQDGFAKLVRLRDIIDNLPANIKISPVAMVPHKSRCYRVILDLSFELLYKDGSIPSVTNGATELRAPQKAMAELGQVVRRIISLLAKHCDPAHPFKFAKIDIKDGFWRMVVSEDDAWNFCYAIPPASNTDDLLDTLLVVPTALQMGWRESPPYFCTATETARDIIHKIISNDMSNLALHPFEEYMYIHPSGTSQPNEDPAFETISPPPHEELCNILEVYVDDFVAGTNNLSETHLKQLSRAILHGIHSIFPPPEVSGHNGEDPVTYKKLLNGEGFWSYEKEILGWLFNGQDFTIQLPPDKLEKLINHISEALKASSCPHKHYEKMMGKLNHAAIGMPNGRGLSAPIYNAMKDNREDVPISPDLKLALEDWRTMLKQIAARPTHVLELVPGEPDYVGYVDACKSGVGGVWLSGKRKLKNPVVWHMPWPKDIQDQLISEDNPNGTLTINDLEMAGVLLHWLVLEQIVPNKDLNNTHVGIFCDNKSTVCWSYKLHSKSSKIAQHLLRALGLRQHLHRSSPLMCASIAGKDNRMADIASRSFIMHEFRNSNFLSTFQRLFPLPQTGSWVEFHMTTRLTSPVISCLRGQPLKMGSWLRLQKRDRSTGATGLTTAKRSRYHPSSNPARPSSGTSSSQPSQQEYVPATTDEASKSKFRQFQTRWQPSQRQLNWLANPALSTKQKAHTPSAWHGLWKAGAERIPQPLHNLQFRSQSPTSCSTKHDTNTTHTTVPSPTSP